MEHRSCCKSLHISPFMHVYHIGRDFIFLVYVFRILLLLYIVVHATCMHKAAIKLFHYLILHGFVVRYERCLSHTHTIFVSYCTHIYKYRKNERKKCYTIFYCLATLWRRQSARRPAQISKALQISKPLRGSIRCVLFVLIFFLDNWIAFTHTLWLSLDICSFNNCYANLYFQHFMCQFKSFAHFYSTMYYNYHHHQQTDCWTLILSHYLHS